MKEKMKKVGILFSILMLICAVTAGTLFAAGQRLFRLRPSHVGEVGNVYVPQRWRSWLVGFLGHLQASPVRTALRAPALP